MGAHTVSQPLAGLRVAILGAGKMGGILLQAFLKSKVLEPEQILATVEHAERAGQLSAQWGVDVSTDNVAAAEAADLILIGLKPVTVPEVVRQIRPVLTPQKLLISIAASVRTTANRACRGHGNRRGPSHAKYSLHAGSGHRCPQPWTLCHRAATGPRRPCSSPPSVGP